MISGKLRKLWLGLFILGLLGLVGPSPVQADEGYVVYDAPNVNGFHFTVLANPNPVSVGKIHLLIRVGQPGSVGNETPVRGARLLVTFTHLSGPGSDSSVSYLQRRDMVADESEPGTYEISDSIQNEGAYRIGLTVEVGTQKADSGFEVTAKPQPDDRLMSILLLSLFPLFLGWLVWMYLKNPGPAKAPSVEAEPAATLEEVKH